MMIRFYLLMLFLAFFFAFTTTTLAVDQVTLTAEPIEVPAGGGIGTTRIHWEANSYNEAGLYLIKEDNTLVLAGKGRSGDYEANFILSGQNYEFRLYSDENLDAPLAIITVIGTRKVAYIPNLQIVYQRTFELWALPLFVILLLLSVAGFLARRRKWLELQNFLITAATILAIANASVIISREISLPFDLQPVPDSQETMDGARQIFEGNGYMTYAYDNRAQPPRYPPTFSIALLPFLVSGEYPANIIFGAKFYALFYLGLASFAAWRFGKRLAAMLAAIFIGVSPFVEYYARVILSETFTAGLVLLTVVLLHKPTIKKAVFAGAIVGILVTTRLQMLVCILALLLALPTMRQRVWAALGSAPFLLANGIYNWQTFGSFFKTGYDYWLPQAKVFAVEYAFREYTRGDGPWILPDLLSGWLMIWICPCEKGGPLATIPNFIFYPLVLFGVFWIFSPPFLPFYGLRFAWRNRREPAAKFTLWISGFSVLLFTFYFYQAARFMAAVSTLLLVFAAVELGKKMKRFIQPDSTPDSAAHLQKTPATDGKNLVDSQTN